MKNIILILTLTLMTIGFSACGNGGDASFQGEVTQAPIEVLAKRDIPLAMRCVTSPTATDIDAYETLQSGDTIIKDEDNTSISTYHDIGGIKKVCIISGSAHILR